MEIAVLAEPIPKILWSFQMALWQVTRVDSAAESLALTPACTTSYLHSELHSHLSKFDSFLVFCFTSLKFVSPRSFPSCFILVFKILFLNVGLNVRICSPNKRHLPRKRCRLRRNSNALPRLLPREFILPKPIQCQLLPHLSQLHWHLTPKSSMRKPIVESV